VEAKQQSRACPGRCRVANKLHSWWPSALETGMLLPVVSPTGVVHDEFRPSKHVGIPTPPAMAAQLPTRPGSSSEIEAPGASAAFASPGAESLLCRHRFMIVSANERKTRMAFSHPQMGPASVDISGTTDAVSHALWSTYHRAYAHSTRRFIRQHYLHEAVPPLLSLPTYRENP